MKEFHALIIWENAKKYEDEFLQLLRSKFKIIEAIRIRWDKNLAEKNFAQFYGAKLRNIDYKVKHCGSGPFLLIIFEDSNPCYKLRETSSGTREVNVNIFDFKMKLRKMSGGGHLIHATDSQKEFNHNVAVLLGKNGADYYQKSSENWDGKIEEVDRNVSGVNGWKDWNELFHTLNCSIDYVVLRNFDDIWKNESSDHGDLDLLVSDIKMARTIIGGIKTSKLKNRVQYQFVVGGFKKNIDLRYVGDNYYDSRWETQILKSRKYDFNRGFYIPSNGNHKFSLIYHALIHKMTISQDYKQFFLDNIGSSDSKKLLTMLNEFMHNEQFEFYEPKDITVFYNNKLIGKNRVSIKRRLFFGSLKIAKYLKNRM